MLLTQYMKKKIAANMKRGTFLYKLEKFHSLKKIPFPVFEQKINFFNIFNKSFKKDFFVESNFKILSNNNETIIIKLVFDFFSSYKICNQK